MTFKTAALAVLAAKGLERPILRRQSNAHVLCQELHLTFHKKSDDDGSSSSESSVWGSSDELNIAANSEPRRIATLFQDVVRMPADLRGTNEIPYAVRRRPPSPTYSVQRLLVAVAELSAQLQQHVETIFNQYGIIDDAAWDLLNKKADVFIEMEKLTRDTDKLGPLTKIRQELRDLLSQRLHSELLEPRKQTEKVQKTENNSDFLATSDLLDFESGAVRFPVGCEVKVFGKNLEGLVIGWVRDQQGRELVLVNCGVGDALTDFAHSTVLHDGTRVIPCRPQSLIRIDDSEEFLPLATKIPLPRSPKSVVAEKSDAKSCLSSEFWEKAKSWLAPESPKFHVLRI